MLLRRIQGGRYTDRQRQTDRESESVGWGRLTDSIDRSLTSHVSCNHPQNMSRLFSFDMLPIVSDSPSPSSVTASGGGSVASSPSASTADASATKIQALIRGVRNRRPCTIEDKIMQKRAAPIVIPPQPTPPPAQAQPVPSSVMGAVSAPTPPVRPQPPPSASPPTNVKTISGGKVTRPTPTPSSTPATPQLTSQLSTPDLRPNTTATITKQPLGVLGARSSSAQNLTIKRGATPEPLAAVVVPPQPHPLPISSPPSEDAELDRLADGVSVLSFSSSSLVQPLCLVAAEARLSSARRVGGRTNPTSALGLAQLLDERRALHKELQIAKEKHAPLLSSRALSSSHDKLHSSGHSSSRARSLSPAPSKNVLCDGCTGLTDWKVIYQPILLAYKMVNAAIKAKTEQTTQTRPTSGNATQTTNATTTPTPPQQPTSLHTTPLSFHGLSSNINAHSTSTSSSASNGRLSPLTSTPAFVTPVAVRARGIRKVASASVLGSTGGASVSAPVSRAGSRAASPAPNSNGIGSGLGISTLPSVGGTNNFAQWSQQSQSTIQAAQVPTNQTSSAFKPNTTQSNSFAPYINGTTGGASADWQRLKLQRKKV